MTGWLFEAMMLLAFGVSWPASIAKSLRTRFVRGKSPMFMCIVMSGYVCGIIHKTLNPPTEPGIEQYVLWLYVMDLLLVTTDLVLYILFRKNTAPRTA
jgi:hypothetical protein